MMPAPGERITGLILADTEFLTRLYASFTAFQIALVVPAGEGMGTVHISSAQVPVTSPFRNIAEVS